MGYYNTLGIADRELRSAISRRRQKKFTPFSFLLQNNLFFSFTVVYLSNVIVDVKIKNKTMKEQTKIYRHGEIAFVEVSNLPEGLTLSDSKVLIKGQNGHSHSIDNGLLYFVNDGIYTFGYLVAKNTSLLHDEHGVVVDGVECRVALLPDGIYQLRKQQEFINNELKPVID